MEREMIETVYHYGIDTVTVIEPKRTPAEQEEWHKRLESAVADFMRAVYALEYEQEENKAKDG
jgi:hypothetical protein